MSAYLIDVTIHAGLNLAGAVFLTIMVAPQLVVAYLLLAGGGHE